MKNTFVIASGAITVRLIQLLFNIQTATMYFVIILFVVVLTPNSAFSSICKSEFEETICENVVFSSKITLNSDTNKLIIKNATGVITAENFSSLKAVTEVTITRSELTQIEAGALCSIPNLNSIMIFNNKKFPKITKNLLKSCQNLKKIYIDGPGVEVENGAFAETGDLNTLTLNDTVLSHHVIGKATFEGLDSVKSLTIQHSTVCKITKDAFKSMKNLKFLDLQGNKIEEIARETFWGLPELKVLNLSDNKLKNLTWDEFKNLKSLRALFLERNVFNNVNVDKLVKNVPDLERIFLSYDKLSHNTIEQIDSTLPKFKINVIYTNAPTK